MLGVIIITTSKESLSQTTISTQVGSTNYTAGNGLSGNCGITFVVENNSGGPINLTKVANFMKVASNGATMKLWYHPTSLSGATPNVTAADGWVLIETKTNLSVSVDGVMDVFDNLLFTIPNATSYRFALESSSAISYSGASPVPAPSTFSDGGVTLKSGDVLINGSNIGYSITFPAGTLGNNPRWFTGAITYVPASPCVAPPNAGNAITNATLACPNTPFGLSLQGASFGTGLTYQWQSSTDSVSWINQVGATNSSFSTSALQNTYYRCILTCNSVSDTSTPVKVSMRTLLSSGTYTINANQATSGTNFNSFNDAITAMSCGIAGPVVFNVDSNTYTGKITINNIPGLSATNTVTFNGNGSKIIHTSDAADPTNYVLQIKDANYITFDRFVFELTNTSTKGMIVNLWNASYNTIKNSKLINDANASSSLYAGITLSGSSTSATSATTSKYNVIEDNEIIGGYYGITLAGTSATKNVNGNIIRRNKIKDFYLYGIYNIASDSTQIVSNEIYRQDRTVYTTCYGIYLGTNSKYINISKNIIRDFYNNQPTFSGTSAGIYLTSTDAPAGQETIITNNVIYGINGNSTTYGIYNSSSDGMFVFHNTIFLSGGATTAGTGYGIYQTTSATRIDIKNNIIYVQKPGSGNKSCLYFNTTTSTITSNYNDLFVDNTVVGTGALNIGNRSTTGYATLAAWQAAPTTPDLNSVSARPIFAGATLLKPNSIAINDVGTPILSVTDDITGAVRSSSPDIGAYEFTPINDDAGINVFVTPVEICPGTANVSVSLKNYGAINLTSALINWTVNNVLQTPFSFIGSILPGEDTILTIGTFSVSANTNYNLKVWSSSPNSSIDGNANNDTVYKNNLKTGLTGTVTVGGVGADYPTITAAINDLDAYGVCGPVVVSVNPSAGPYNEQITIKNIKGASSTNTITFKGNNSEINYISNQSSFRHVILLDGVQYVTVDSFIIKGYTGLSTSNYAYGIRVSSGSDYNTISNNKIYVSDSTTSLNFSGIVFSGSATSATTAGVYKFNTIRNNEIYGGYYGITIAGTSGNVAASKGNKIEKNRVIQPALYGIYATYQDSILVDSNSVSNKNRNVYSTQYGLYFSNVTNKTEIKNNRISDYFLNLPTGTSTFYGIYITASDHIVGNEALVYNNEIFNIGGNGAQYGFYNGSSDGIFYYNNSVSLDYYASTTGLSYGFYQVTAASNLDYKNNVISITRAGVGAKIGLYFATSTTAFSSNFNDIYVPSGAIGYYNAVSYTNLADWQAINTTSPYDINSITSNPLFNSNRILIPQTGTPLAGAGTTILSITTDRLGNIRSAPTYIGAYEIAGDFAGPKITAAPIANTTSTSNYVLNNYVTISDVSGVDTSLGNKPRVYFKRQRNANTYVDNTSASNGWKYTEASTSTSPFSFVINYSLLDSAVAVGDELNYFFVAKDLLGNVTTYPADLNVESNSINITAPNFPALSPGSYNIGSGISGTILVGSGKAFTSLTGNGGLFEYINNNIVNGNVEIFVTSDLTEPGTHPLNQVAELGVGGYTISIKPNGDTLRTISGSYAGGLIRLNGADRITIDGSGTNNGRYIKVLNNTSSSNNAAIQLISLGNNLGATHNTIKNCIITAGTAGNAIGVHIGGPTLPYSAGATNNNNKIIGNHIFRGSVGIYSGGIDTAQTDSLIITDNIIGSDVTAENLRLYGMALEVSKNSRIERNIIKNIINTAAQQAWGIALYDGFANGIISKNSLQNISSGSGAFGGRGIEIVSNKLNENIVIDNNFIADMKGAGSNNLNSTGTVGLSIRATGGVKLYYNSVHMPTSFGISTSSTSANYSAAFHFGNGATGIDMLNNSLSNTRVNSSDTSTAYALYSEVGDTSFNVVDYNNYYVSGAQGVVAYFPTSGNVPDLVNLKLVTGKNANSITATPNYASNTDLHSSGVGLFQKGTPIAGFTSDIDQELRNTTTPCIGADEFVVPPNDLALISILYPNSGECGSNVDSLVLIVENLGTANQTNASVVAHLSGAILDTINTTIPSIPSGTRDTVVIGYFNSNISDTVNFNVFVNLANDADRTNDSTKVEVIFNATPAMPTAMQSGSACYGSSATLIASNGQANYTWYDAASGGNVLTVNDTLITPTLTSNTNFWVTTSSGNGGKALKITEIDIGGTDMIEIQNLSNSTLNTSGWKVIVSDSYTLINSVNSIAWNLPAQMSAGQVMYKTDNSSDNYWGNNLFWNPGAFPSFSGWAMILDNNDQVVDAVFMNWPLANISSANIIHNGKPIVIGSEWASNGIDITSVASTSSVSRSGNSDNNTATDFVITTTTKGTRNTVLSNAFVTGGCESDRVMVSVNLLPRPSGSTIVQASPYQGVFNAGTLANPDEACLADTLTYELTPPTGFTAAGLGTTWTITNATLKTLSGVTAAGSVTYTGLNMMYVAATGDLDSTLRFSAKIVDLSTGCDSEIVRYLKVNKAPVVSLGTDLTICDGTPTTIDAGNPGSTYLWSTGDTTQTISVKTAGTYSVIVTNTSGCSSYDTIVVNTNPSPVQALGADIQACVGQNVVLDAGNPNATYLWNTGATTRTINPVANGTYIVTVTGTGGCSTSDTIEVVFNSLPVVDIGADINICIEDTTVLDAGNPGSTYLWSTGDTTQTIKVNAAGTYSVTVTNANGCSNTDQMVVTNKPAPIATFTDTALNGLNVKFTAIIVAGNSYSWNFGDPTSPTNTSLQPTPIHEFTQPGTYTVTLTVTNVASGCVTIEKRTISVAFVGISSANKEVFNFYAAPNPYAGSTNLNFNLKKSSMVKIEMFDLLGRKVKTVQDLTELPMGDHKVELVNTSAELPNGVYLIKLNVDGNESVIRVQDNTSK